MSGFHCILLIRDVGVLDLQFKANATFALLTVSCIFGLSNKQMKPKSTRKMLETEPDIFIFYIHFRSLALSVHIFAFVLSAYGEGGVQLGRC